MEPFGRFYLDKEKDIVVDLFRSGEELRYVLRTPNHNSGNLITNLARLCELPLDYDDTGLKVIRGVIPSYVDGENRSLWIFRMGNTKIANIWPDGQVELKASIPSISKVLMSQTRNYRLSVAKTIVKTYIFSDCKFHTDLHTHMSANLEPDVLIALGIRHQIRYPLYYIKKLGLRLSETQRAALERDRAAVEAAFADSPLSGKYRERKIDDACFLNFADLILNDPADAARNIARIRASLAVPKDGQAVFADLEKVYLYRYVFTKGVASDRQIALEEPFALPDAEVASALRRMLRDRETPAYRDFTLFQNKLLWIARGYRRQGVSYAEISDTALCREEAAPEELRQIHEAMPAITAETGVLLRFLAAVRRTPLTIVRDSVTPNDYLAGNLRTIRAVAADPYVAGSDIVGEEINDIGELSGLLRELVRIAGETPGFVIRVHAGENDSLRDNVAKSLHCVTEALAPGQPMPPMRIGHGLYTTNLHTAQGQRLLQELRERGVVLEFQITSNVRLNNLSNLDSHPLGAYLRAGVLCVQGTDGGALYGTNSIDEELSLEKLLGLSHAELCQMRRAEAAIEAESRRVFAEKSARFEALLAGEDVAEALRRRIGDSAQVDVSEWPSAGKLESAAVLADRIEPLPETGIPLIVAGGSFSGERRAAPVSEAGKALLDRLLRDGDPEKLFFVIGHRLSGYERCLVERNRGRFRIYAFVPTLLTQAERDRLRRSGVRVRVSVEPSGNGIYKSFAYEIFKRRRSLLLVFDGKSPAANLVQEAKNGREKCLIFVDGRSRVLRAKARTLGGYVRLLEDTDDPAAVLLAAAEDPDGTRK